MRYNLLVFLSSFVIILFTVAKKGCTLTVPEASCPKCKRIYRILNWDNGKFTLQNCALVDPFVFAVPDIYHIKLVLMLLSCALSNADLIECV